MDQVPRSRRGLITSCRTGWHATTTLSQRSRPASLLVIVMMLACASVNIDAQAGGAASDAENTARIQFIERALDAGQRSADLWWYGWLAAYSAAGVAQSASAAVTDDRQLRQDLGIGALTSFVGAAGQFVFPLR